MSALRAWYRNRIRRACNASSADALLNRRTVLLNPKPIVAFFCRGRVGNGNVAAGATVGAQVAPGGAGQVRLVLNRVIVIHHRREAQVDIGAAAGPNER